MKRVVADAGPLIHLQEAGAIHLLSHLGEILVVLWAAVKEKIGRQETLKYLANLEGSPLWISSRVRIEARQAVDRIFRDSDT